MLSTRKLTYKNLKNGGIQYSFEISNGIRQSCSIKEQGENVILVCFNKKYHFKSEWFFREETKKLFEYLAEQEVKEFE